MKPPCDFALRVAASHAALSDLPLLASWRLRVHAARCARCAQTIAQMQAMEQAARALYANAAPPIRIAQAIEARLTRLPDPTIRFVPKDKKMQRNLSYALAACAVYFGLSYGFQHKFRPLTVSTHVTHTEAAMPTPTTPMKMTLSDRQSEHVTIYMVDVEDGQTHETLPFGKLTKIDEWWMTPTARRQETVQWDSLKSWAQGDRSVPLARAPGVWKNQMHTAYDPQTRKVSSIGGLPDRNPQGWKDYSLEAIVGTAGRSVTDKGVEVTRAGSIHTLVLQNRHSPNGPRWVCQMNDDTGLPIRIEDTNKRGGKWITTLRYDFEFDRPLPASLFDADQIAAPVPAAFVSPDFPDGTPAPAPMSPRSEHVAFYNLEGGFPNGTLTKVEEWWKQGDLLRQETPLNSDLTALNGRGVVPADRHWRTIYQGKKQWQYSPETKQVGVYPKTNGPENVMCGLPNYSLKEIAGDDVTGLRERHVSEGGTRTENGRRIHTLIVEPNGVTDGPRWVCQFDAKTGLPIQADDTNKRNNQWVTTMRYRFEFDRPLPRDVFDISKLQNPPPAAATFPATE